MKRDRIWAILAGILLTLLVLLVVEELVFPNMVALYMIPMSALVVFLWLNAYRISRKRQAV